MRSVELVDARLYHLDLTFCPLDDRRAIVAPDGWDAYGRKVVEALVPEPLVLDADEALAFCANSVVVGTNVVMPSCPPPVGRQLEAWGFDVAVCAGRRVPQGGRRLPLPHARARRRALSAPGRDRTDPVSGATARTTLGPCWRPSIRGIGCSNCEYV